MSPCDGVCWNWHKFYDVENGMDSRHQFQEFEVVHMRTNSVNDRIGPEVVVGEHFRGPSGVDIQGIQENLFADLKLGSRDSTLVVVLCHIVLRL